LNLRPLGYEPSELPNCSTPRRVPLLYGHRLPLANQTPLPAAELGAGQAPLPAGTGSVIQI
jgi:hypothetical protein